MRSSCSHVVCQRKWVKMRSTITIVAIFLTRLLSSEAITVSNVGPILRKSIMPEKIYKHIKKVYREPRKPEVEIDLDFSNTLLNNYSNIRSEKKKQFLATIVRITSQHFARFEANPYSPHSSDSKFLFTLLKQYSGAELRNDFGEFLVKTAGISPLSITKYLNHICTIESCIIITQALQFHLNLMNQLARVILPEKISPLLLDKILLCLQSHYHAVKTNTSAKNLYRLSQEFVYYFTRNRLTLSSFYHRATNTLFTNLTTYDILQNSTPLLSHSLPFYMRDLESKVLLRGSFYDIKEYFNRGITPLKFQSERKSPFLKCTNKILTHIYKNNLLTPSDKLELLFQIIDRLDSNLPFTCYFEEKKQGKNLVAEYFSDEMRKQNTLQSNIDKWKAFLRSLLPNNEATYYYAMQKLRKEYKNQMSLFPPKTKASCSALHMEELLTLLTPENQGVKEAFCKLVQECRDLSISLTARGEKQTVLKAATKHCAAKDVTRHGLERITAHYRIDDKKRDVLALNDVVIFCLKHSSDGNLYPSCILLNFLSSDPIEQLNIYDTEAAAHYIVTGRVSYLVSLGFSYASLLSSSNLEIYLSYYEKNLSTFFAVPLLLEELSNQITGIRTTVIKWITKQILNAESKEEFLGFYQEFSKLLIDYEREHMLLEAEMDSNSLTLRSLLSAFHTDLIDPYLDECEIDTHLTTIEERIKLLSLPLSLEESLHLPIQQLRAAGSFENDANRE